MVFSRRDFDVLGETEFNNISIFGWCCKQGSHYVTIFIRMSLLTLNLRNSDESVNPELEESKLLLDHHLILNVNWMVLHEGLVLSNVG